MLYIFQHTMDITQLAHVFGCLMKKDQQWYASPLALDPHLVDQTQFNHVVHIQPIIQKLKSILINNPHYIKALKGLNDDFVDNLLLCRKLKSIEFGIIRSDYISDANGVLKNVETNCIASSFSCLSSRVSKIHQILSNTSRIVPNQCILQEALNTACTHYNEACTPTDPSIFLPLSKSTSIVSDMCILMIVQPTETNLSDQLGLLDGLQYPMFRITFDQVFDLQIIHDTLVYNNKYKVAVVYYRSGYQPNDYPSQRQWDARRILEHSNAINCPSVSLQLMGLKKIQEMTSTRDVLFETLKNEEEVNLLLSTYMALYPMDQDTKEGQLALQLVREAPEKYVLKPQREGGSNNYYDQAILKHLDGLKHVDEYKKYILMEKIVSSTSQMNTLIRFMNGHYTKVKGATISEIGVYGYFIKYNNREAGLVVNKAGGYLTRTKLIGTNEGGVASGYSYLNSLQFDGQ